MLNRYRVENQAQGGKLVLLALAVRLADLAPAPVADRLRRHVDHRVCRSCAADGPPARRPAGPGGQSECDRAGQLPGRAHGGASPRPVLVIRSLTGRSEAAVPPGRSEAGQELSRALSEARAGVLRVQHLVAPYGRGRAAVGRAGQAHATQVQTEACPGAGLLARLQHAVHVSAAVQ